MIGPTCTECQTIHSAADVVVAGSRFNETGPSEGYRPKRGGMARSTRAEAMADVCAEISGRRPR